MLQDEPFAAKLKALFDEMNTAAAGTPMTNEQYANKLAKLIDDQIKTAGIPAGKVIVGVAGAATGTANSAEITVV